MPQDLLIALFGVLLVGLLSYITNQLPPLKQFRGSGFLLVLLAIKLVLLGWVWQVSSTGDRIYQAHQALFDGGKLVLMGAFAASLLGLISGLRGKEASQNAAPQPNLRDRLLQAELEEVAKLKDDSLHHQILIDLKMTDEREQVGSPSKQLIINEATIDLPVATQMIEVFRRSEVGGRLLILGDPGAGKTIMLMELAKSLLEAGQQDLSAPVPVILDLSTWREDQKTLADWLVEQISHEKYTLDRNMSREWLEAGRFLPLLDGLDELGLDRQCKAIAAINQYLKADARLDLVVCCRWEEYKASEDKLTELNRAIRLQPLTDCKIRDYLKQLSRDDLWQPIQSNPELLELSRSPLFLNITVIAYQGQPIQNRQDLFNAYIDRRFELPLQKRVYPAGKAPNPLQTLHYLIWLAQQMKRESKTEFLIEQMQPSLLKNIQTRRVYGTLVALLFSLIYLLAEWLIGGNSAFAFQYNLIPYLIFIPLLIVFAHNQKIEPLETLRWSWRDFCNIWISQTNSYIKISFIIGVLAALRFCFSINQGISIVDIALSCVFALFSASFFFIFMCLILGVPSALISTLKGSEILNRTGANEGIKRSIRNSIIVVSIIWFSSSLSLLLLTRLLFQFPEAGEVFMSAFSSYSGIVLAILRTGLGIAFIFSIQLGLVSLIQHFALRLTLSRNQHIPWNYAKFLEYASDRRLIQQVGGRYRFIHRLLRDHFAAMELR